jgi:hypothetical protein
MRAEISYDLVMVDGMAFVEGSYRLPGADWQVVIVSRRDVSEPEVISQVWDSGVAGSFIRFPRRRPLNKAAIEGVFSAPLNVSEWVQDRGPDSMQLR